jgi:hypothetical protein
MRAMWNGKRQTDRRVCHLKAQLRLADGKQQVDCVIYDLSPAGARIALRDKVALPPYFDLYIPTRSDTKFALVRWQHGAEVGLEFTPTRPQENPILMDLLARCAALEASLAEVCRQSEEARTLAQGSARRMAALEAKNGELLERLHGAFETMSARVR